MQTAAAANQVVEGCTPATIPDEVFASDKPLLLKGLVADWPAVTQCREGLKATTKYLARFWTQEPVTAYVGDGSIDGRFGYNEAFNGFNFQSGNAPLPHVMGKLLELEETKVDQSIYVGSTVVDRWLPGFRKDNDLQLPTDDALVNFWMGNRTRVSAHYDFPDNIACVVAGDRKFTLFPPEQVSNLYVGPVDRTPSGQAISLVDFANPDFERFPKFQAALDAAVTFDMSPGDAIFVPSMWWQHVASLSPFNLMVNYWWVGTHLHLGSPATALMHAMLTIRDLPARQRAAWRTLFDHYIFDADESVYEHIPQSGRGCLAPGDDEAMTRLRAELLNRLNQ